MPDRNGNWIKIASLGALGGLILTVLGIMSFAGGAVDERIDVKILSHESATEAVHQKQISDIQQDIAVMQVQQQQIADNVEEIKDLLRER